MSNKGKINSCVDKQDKQHDNGPSVIGDRITNQKYSYDLVNSWINNADSKITVATSISVGLFSVITYVSEQIHISLYSNNNYLYYILTVMYSWFPVIGFILLLISIFFYSCALVPNLKSNDEEHNKMFPLFFGDISNEELKKYKKKMLHSTDTDFLEELIYETHFNSRLCSHKMKMFKLGYIFSFLSVALVIIALGIKFFLSM